MNGARMRSCSLAGTRPRKTSRSVPRLSAPWSARTLTSPACGVLAGSGRISACPGPTYHNAYAFWARVLTITPVDEIHCLPHVDESGRLPLYRAPAREGNPSCHARSTRTPRRGRDGGGAARVAGAPAGAVLCRGGDHHDGPAVAPGRRAVGRRLRCVRHRAARALRGDASVVGDRLLERDDRFFHHALCPEPHRAGVSRGGSCQGRRTDRHADGDP